MEEVLRYVTNNTAIPYMKDDYAWVSLDEQK